MPEPVEFRPVSPTQNQTPFTATKSAQLLQNYSEQVNSKIPHVLRIIATFWYVVYIPFYAFIAKVTDRSYYDSVNNVYHPPENGMIKQALLLFGLMLCVLTAYTIVRQFFFITRTMRHSRWEPILTAHVIMSAIIFLGFVFGSLIAYGQFATSAIPIWTLPLYGIGLLLHILISPTLAISQYIYIQTNGQSRKVAILGKVFRVLGYLLASLVALVIGWFIVIISDPSTE